MPSSKKWLSIPENQEKLRLSRQKWKENNPNYKRIRDPEKVKQYKSSDPLYQRKKELKKKYGLEWADYETMFKQQNGACPICECNLTFNHQDTVVDHCHATNKVRGLLCRKCNMALGLLNDNKQSIFNALKYLGE